MFKEASLVNGPSLGVLLHGGARLTGYCNALGVSLQKVDLHGLLLGW